MYTKAFFLCIFMGFSLLAKDPPQLVLGNPNAKTEVIVYTALTCGACAKFHQNILAQFPRNLKKQPLPKKLSLIGWFYSFFWKDQSESTDNKNEFDYRVVIRHYPLDAHSLEGSIAVECAPENEKLRFYEQIFLEQDSLIQRGDNIEGFLKNIASELKIKLDHEKREIVKQEILEDFQKVQGLIYVTPTFFVGNKDQPLGKRRKGSGELSPEVFNLFLEGK